MQDGASAKVFRATCVLSRHRVFLKSRPPPPQPSSPAAFAGPEAAQHTCGCPGRTVQREPALVGHESKPCSSRPASGSHVMPGLPDWDPSK